MVNLMVGVSSAANDRFRPKAVIPNAIQRSGAALPPRSPRTSLRRKARPFVLRNSLWDKTCSQDANATGRPSDGSQRHDDTRPYEALPPPTIAAKNVPGAGRQAGDQWEGCADSQSRNARIITVRRYADKSG
jgi:hypothetical protein